MKREFRILFALQCAFYLSRVSHCPDFDCVDQFKAVAEPMRRVIASAEVFLEPPFKQRCTADVKST